jgi:hypothetical protein
MQDPLAERISVAGLELCIKPDGEKFPRKKFDSHRYGGKTNYEYLFER